MNIHPLADVQSANIGINTQIWQYAVILKDAVIGENCNINCHTFVENKVRIGNNVTVKSGVFLWDGIEVEDDVFIGPNVTFTNDKFPRSKQYPGEYQSIKLNIGCSIGANSTILGGISIGAYAIIGAGSVVTKNVPAYALVKGNPATISGWLDEKGRKLVKIEDNRFTDQDGNEYQIIQDKISRL